MKIIDLKERLTEYLALLDEYPDDTEVTLCTNTYFVNSTEYLAQPEGFIDMRHVCTECEDDDEDDEDDA